MSNVPKAREILQSALAMRADEDGMRASIAEALGYMTRVHTKPRAKPESRKMTPVIARQVQAFFGRNQGMSVRQIADIFQIGTGRVSEAIAGHWDDPTWVAQFKARVAEEMTHG